MTFIVFEGGEGTGKSTQLNLLHAALVKKGLPCLATREPGGTPWAEAIRGLFKQGIADAEPHSVTELLLLLAARNDHLQKVVRPALQEGKIVLCDRFLDSTYVYQCLLKGLPKQLVDTTSHGLQLAPPPTLTFVFLCPVEISQQRVHQDQQQLQRSHDRFDAQQRDFHDHVQQAYQTILHQAFPYPDGSIPLRIAIDAAPPPDAVFALIRQGLQSHLGINI